MGRIIARYFDLLRRRPVLTNVISSIVVATTGDYLSQKFESRFKDNFVVDESRIRTMFLWGGTIVPLLWGKFYNVVDSRFPKKSFSHISSKVFLAAAIMTPLMNALYITFCIAVENQNKNTFAEIKEKIVVQITNDLIPIVVQSAQIWVPLNTLNWTFFPPHTRLLFTTVANVGWNAYISFMLHRPSIVESKILDPNERTQFYIAYIEVLPKFSDHALELLRQRQAASRLEGSLRCDVFQRRDRPHHFAIIEECSETSIRSCEHFRKTLHPLLAAGYDERQHSGLTTGPLNGEVTAATVVAITHVDFIPPKKDEGIEELKFVVRESRREYGNQCFNVLQQVTRPNHLTLVEMWADKGVFEAHESAPHTVQFRQTITPLSGALFDQRLYKIVT